jgi:hypothetical protein
LEQQYGISPETRLRWEKTGRLPARDVHVGGLLVGWKPATLEAAERGEKFAAATGDQLRTYAKKDRRGAA